MSRRWAKVKKYDEDPSDCSYIRKFNIIITGLGNGSCKELPRLLRKHLPSCITVTQISKPNKFAYRLCGTENRQDSVTLRQCDRTSKTTQFFFISGYDTHTDCIYSFNHRPRLRTFFPSKCFILRL